MSKFVGFKARFGLFDEAAAELAENLGTKYEPEDVGEGTLYIDVERVVAVMPMGEPRGSECTLMLDTGDEFAVMVPPEDVLPHLL